MKYMFVSDIHGNVDVLREILDIFEEEKADKLILLGDTAASNLPDNEEIAGILNAMVRQVEVIQGNCDNLMLEDRLEMPMYESDNLYIGDQVITITHGNRYNMYDLPPYCGNIFVQGHTHIPLLQKMNDRIFANPGSATYPRGTDMRCYLIITEDSVQLKTFEGSLVKEIK